MTIEISNYGTTGVFPRVGLFHNSRMFGNVALEVRDDEKEWVHYCDLTEVAKIRTLKDIFEQEDPIRFLEGVLKAQSQRRLGEYMITRKHVIFGPPIDKDSRAEVWGAGVTYTRSRQAREDESKSSGIYDRVYGAKRPELFHKAAAWRVVGSGDKLQLRTDTKWCVPEPEFALVINSQGIVTGFTLGNDLSCRDIEGENPLYLSQAKINDGFCSLGDVVQLGPYAEPMIRDWDIKMSIDRAGSSVFSGETKVGNIRKERKLLTVTDGPGTALADWLFDERSFPDGAVLLTGTGIVPPDDFTLKAGDLVQIEIPQAGIKLSNGIQ